MKMKYDKIEDAPIFISEDTIIKFNKYIIVRSALGNYYKVKQLKYNGNGEWEIVGNKIKVDVEEIMSCREVGVKER